MQILLFGASGQLAQDLRLALVGDEVIGFPHSEADVCDAPTLEALGSRFNPDCLINTAAYHRVDDCEDELEKSLAVNVVGVQNLVRVANQVGAAHVHFSTD